MKYICEWNYLTLWFEMWNVKCIMWEVCVMDSKCLRHLINHSIGWTEFEKASVNSTHTNEKMSPKSLWWKKKKSHQWTTKLRRKIREKHVLCSLMCQLLEIFLHEDIKEFPKHSNCQRILTSRYILCVRLFDELRIKWRG